MNSQEKNQSKLLIYSVIFSIILTIAAFITGFIASSQVIFFDGVFSLIGIVLTYISILSVKFMKKKDFNNYPFGKAALEPFIVITQYSIILVVSITNMVSAVQSIFIGGKVVDIKAGILYGLLSTIFCFIAFTYLEYLTRDDTTAIEKVETEQWKYSFLYSLVMLISFSIAWILEKTPLVSYVTYVDPVLAILVTIPFIKTSVSSIYMNVKELLYATPSPEIVPLIKEKVDHISNHYRFLDVILRIGKVGQELIIEIDYIVEENSEIDSIRLQDRLRTELDRSLSEIPYKKWLNVNFTGSMKWVE